MMSAVEVKGVRCPCRPDSPAPPQPEQVLNVRAVDRLEPGPIELFESFDDREVSGFDAPFGRPIEAQVRFPFQQPAEELDVNPVFWAASAARVS